MYIEKSWMFSSAHENGGKNKSVAFTISSVYIFIYSRGVPRLNTSFGKAQIMALINCAVTGEPKKTMLFYTNL